MDRTWSVYILENRNGSYYTGVTNDLDARYAAHAEGRGARAVRMAGGPRRIAWQQGEMAKAEAHRLERAIKALSRKGKERLMREGLAAVGLGADGRPLPP